MNPCALDGTSFRSKGYLRFEIADCRFRDLMTRPIRPHVNLEPTI